MSAGALVTYERALEIREPMAARCFFISVILSPPGAVGHVAALELLTQEGRASSRGTHDSTGAPLSERQGLEP
jgi:hypothetical protein